MFSPCSFTEGDRCCPRGGIQNLLRASVQDVYACKPNNPHLIILATLMKYLFNMFNSQVTMQQHMTTKKTDIHGD